MFAHIIRRQVSKIASSSKTSQKISRELSEKSVALLSGSVFVSIAALGVVHTVTNTKWIAEHKN